MRRAELPGNVVCDQRADNILTAGFEKLSTATGEETGVTFHRVMP